MNLPNEDLVTQTSRKPILDHLDDLLKCLRRVFLWVVLGAVAGYIFADLMVEWIERPLLELQPLVESGRAVPSLITTMPFEKLWTYLRVGLIAGIFLVFPLIVYEISRFIGPGLKPVERRRVGWLGASIYLMFLVGLCIGYYVVLPLILKAVWSFGSETITSTWTISAYVNASLGILLVSAVLVELPVIMVFLSSWGWVDSKQWSKGRRLAIVINAIVSGILSPPDALSMLVMMVPLHILFESGILLARMAEWFNHDDRKSA